MTDLAYELLDVFTSAAGCGSPLAVFADAPERPDAVMQAIAPEIDVSETVFVR